MAKPAVEEPPRRSLLAFVAAVPIAVVGGLIGLGGAEFRLPVLAGPLRYAARQAVPLNLSVSLVTLLAAFLTRAGTLSLEPLAPFYPAIVAMIGGALVTAWLGPALAARLSNERLESVILVLLLAIGGALIVESFLPGATAALVPEALWPAVALALGLGIGLVSSLLGVAGGELIIPSFVFAFGAPIKLAGTASLLVSLPTVTVGVLRWARRGGYADRDALRETVLPMAVGSVIGAVTGGLLVGVVPASALKLGLGVILIVSALRVFSHRRSR
jgi:uncharacterized membrane protein YfcA